MLEDFFTPASFSHETAGSGKYTFTLLPRLYCPRHEAPPLTYPLHVVYDGDRRVPCQYEVAVHTVNKKCGVASGGRG